MLVRSFEQLGFLKLNLSILFNNLIINLLIIQVCKGESLHDDVEGQLMNCLISKKNVQAMREKPKCRAVVESFQVIYSNNIFSES